MMQLLAQGWGSQKVQDRLRSYARNLDPEVQFMTMNQSDKAEARALIDEHVTMQPGWTIPKDEGGVVARDVTGKMIGALLVRATGFDGRYSVIIEIRAVAVDPQWRSKGLGVVLLGMADRPWHPSATPFFLGNCAEADARFYQKLGYTVLQPGSEFPLPVGEHVINVAIGNPDYPCCFFKE
ncbi:MULTISPECIES: GNAT family N-acetyltransferase [Paenarthrobacter]|uniref:GNAT family N-acetyltransferase n=1 Tax=Paenarthrobacter ureafaciens TaxID=37931 RepID=A0AAX3EQL3_PAEUR|nr:MULTISPECIES: GNAT family N-acetyltransferase [Paenarthrobacter]MDO5867121.1 GNAT family N-acetyltransferase [Paenarthrobacter sp. SD-2]MDO5878375.1 GNAT family N-acetyltransferase [Paenarthrobacter sp. SD-1]UYV95602.1 GNAT family N-acetyltransferase [Paenarthrobacter ureafaciens]UYW00245.1 GNAT family N-acetyltransferase [Paenarthrobacter ureafaciens]